MRAAWFSTKVDYIPMTRRRPHILREPRGKVVGGASNTMHALALRLSFPTDRLQLRPAGLVFGMIGGGP
jgi:hypothetical protein